MSQLRHEVSYLPDLHNPEKLDDATATLRDKDLGGQPVGVVDNESEFAPEASFDMSHKNVTPKLENGDFRPEEELAREGWSPKGNKQKSKVVRGNFASEFAEPEGASITNEQAGHVDEPATDSEEVVQSEQSTEAAQIEHAPQIAQQQESTIPKGVMDYINNLASHGEISARELQKAQTLEELTSMIEEMGPKHELSVYQYGKIKGLIQGGEAPQAETYVPPKKFVDYISEIAKKGGERLRGFNYWFDIKHDKESLRAFLDEYKDAFRSDKYPDQFKQYNDAVALLEEGSIDVPINNVPLTPELDEYIDGLNNNLAVKDAVGKAITTGSTSSVDDIRQDGVINDEQYNHILDLVQKAKPEEVEAEPAAVSVEPSAEPVTVAEPEPAKELETEHTSSPDVVLPTETIEPNVPDETVETTDQGNKIEIKKPEKQKVAAEIVTTPESSEQIPELNVAREEYVKQYIDWKNKHRAKKTGFHKLLANLGVERAVPESEIPQEFKDAQKIFNDAKKAEAERQGLFGKSEKRTRNFEGSVLNLKDFTYEVNPALTNFSYDQSDILCEAISNGLPPLEKGVIRKSLEWWGKRNRATRIAVSTGLMTGVGVVFGGLGAVAAGTYAGYRFAKGYGKSILGAQSAQLTGKLVDSIQKKQNTTLEKGAEEEYETYVDAENFNRREEEAMKFAEKMANKRTRQQLFKTAVMAGTGVGVAFETGVHEAHAMSGGGGTEHLTQNGGATAHLEDKPSIKHDIRLPNENSGSHEFEPVKPVDVSLSPKGFIQDIHNLKAKLVAEYGGKDNVPEQLRTNIMQKSDVELAKQFGFYDADNGLSGKGFAGEHLSIDDHGNLIYQHLDGSKDTIINTTTNVVTKFKGDMFDSYHEPSEYEVNHDVSVPEEISQPGIMTDSVPTLNEHLQNTSELPVHTETVQMQEPPISSGTDFQFGNEIIAHQHNGIMVLDDKYQNGPEYKGAREAFVKMFEQNTLRAQLGDNPIPIDFEGGKMYVIQGVKDNPNLVQVLLNGKTIAAGELGVHKIELLNTPGIKSGFFFGDTVYERAFKHAKDILKTLKPVANGVVKKAA